MYTIERETWVYLRILPITVDKPVVSETVLSKYLLDGWKVGFFIPELAEILLSCCWNWDSPASQLFGSERGSHGQCMN